jgi:hypothetical protein
VNVDPQPTVAEPTEWWESKQWNWHSSLQTARNTGVANSASKYLKAVRARKNFDLFQLTSEDTIHFRFFKVTGIELGRCQFCNPHLNFQSTGSSVEGTTLRLVQKSLLITTNNGNKLINLQQYWNLHEYRLRFWWFILTISLCFSGSTEWKCIPKHGHQGAVAAAR